jgi:hypothetical protein
MTLTDAIKADLLHSPPQTQNECCAVAVRAAIAAAGIIPDEWVRSASESLAKGLFGPAFDAASDDQQLAWIDMAESEYRKARAQAVNNPSTDQHREDDA